MTNSGRRAACEAGTERDEAETSVTGRPSRGHNLSSRGERHGQTSAGQALAPVPTQPPSSCPGTLRCPEPWHSSSPEPAPVPGVSGVRPEPLGPRLSCRRMPIPPLYSNPLSLMEKPELLSPDAEMHLGKAGRPGGDPGLCLEREPALRSLKILATASPGGLCPAGCDSAERTSGQRAAGAQPWVTPPRPAELGPLTRSPDHRSPHCPPVSRK